MRAEMECKKYLKSIFWRVQRPLFCLLEGQELFFPGGRGSAEGFSVPWCIRGMGLVVSRAIVAVGILSVDYIKVL